MFSEVSDMYVDIAQTTEYRSVVEQHGSRFESVDEAKAVLAEELTEADIEMKNMWHCFSRMDIDGAESAARLCIKETAQVLAVIKKMRNSNV